MAMEVNCSDYMSYIQKSVMGELSQPEQAALDRHLAECAPCNREQQMYSETVRQLRAEQDVPVPRHFFVYPRESHATPWRAFLQMSRPWQAVAASVLVVAGLVSALAIAQLQVRSADGALVIGFGRLPERKPPTPQVAQLDTSALESRILKAAAEKNRQDSLELLRTLRAEMARSDKAIGREQRALLEQAISNVKLRTGQLVTATAANLEKRTDRSVQDLYRTVSLERERDLAAVDNRINLLAINGEVKSTQTDAILATLLQVAELRMK
jgi:anti-sigma factor RsiW